jgi:cholesterol oxidase
MGQHLRKDYSIVHPRQKRKLNACEPKIYDITTDDNVKLKLTRYKGGKKGPVMLVHGLGVASSIFSTDMIDENLVEYLYKNKYDVWLLDLRVSIDLKAAEKQWNGDELAKNDFPAAVEFIKYKTDSDSVQALVHCYGATTFFMSMLAGLEGIRSIVCSQIATHMVLPKSTKIKTGLHIPSFLGKIGVDSLTAEVDNDNIIEKLYDKALGVYALSEAQGQCSNPTCHRITFMYASLYRHDQLTHLLHDNLDELFGEANMTTFQHLAEICRKGYLVDYDGNDVYLSNLNNLDLPILFISGENNECYLPESTAKTYDLLRHNYDNSNYDRKVIKNYGHIDCIFGKNANKDVFPHMLEHLEKTA